MKLKDLLKDVEDVELTPEQEKQIKDYLGIKGNKRWKPKNGEDYYYLDSCLTINEATFRQNNIDYSRIASYNCFNTAKEANFAIEKYKVYQELKLFAEENNDPIDWKKTIEKKWTFYYDYLEKNLIISDYCHICHFGTIYFSSLELAEQAADKVGRNRIKKYLFGVE